MYLSLDQYFFECLKFNSRRQKIKAPGSFSLKINEQIKKKNQPCIYFVEIDLIF